MIWKLLGRFAALKISHKQTKIYRLRDNRQIVRLNVELENTGIIPIRITKAEVYIQWIFPENSQILEQIEQAKQENEKEILFPIVAEGEWEINTNLNPLETNSFYADLLIPEYACGIQDALITTIFDHPNGDSVWRCTTPVSFENGDND